MITDVILFQRSVARPLSVVVSVYTDIALTIAKAQPLLLFELANTFPYNLLS